MSEYKPVGIFVTENEKNQIIYDDPFRKGGYLVSKKDYTKFRTYLLRYVLAIVVGTLISTFTDIWPAVGVGILTAISGELLFRFKFLRKQCVYLPDFKRQKGSSFFDKIIVSSTRPKKIAKAILFFGLGSLIVINAYIEHYQIYFLVACWVVGVVSMFLGFVYLVYAFKGDK